MKRVTRLLILLMGFLPFFSISMEDDWIAPTVGDSVIYRVDSAGQNFYFPNLEDAIRGWFIHYPRIDCGNSEPSFVETVNPPYHSVTVQFEVSDETCNSPSNLTIRVYEIPEGNVCENPNYQNGVDTDGLDGIDQCHRTQCPNLDVFWSSQSGVSTPSGSICVEGINGAPDCQYNAVENSDGSNSNYTFSPAGQGCSCGNEAVPCVDLDEGEISNNETEEGCVQLGESVLCEANQEEKCPNSICEAGCGFVGERFMCIEATDPNGGLACVANDPRPECQGKLPGECPAGILNCINATPETPPQPCIANDPRPECVGLNVGDIPDSSLSGATTNDINAIGRKLDITNRNLKKIKDNTKDIATELKKQIETDDFSPEDNTDWTDTKSLVIQFTSSGDVNQDEADFKNNFEAQEGFFNSQILGVIPTGGGCQDLSFSFPHADGVISACQYLIHAKIVIEWALILGFIFYIRTTFNRLKPN